MPVKLIQLNKKETKEEPAKYTLDQSSTTMGSSNSTSKIKTAKKIEAPAFKAKYDGHCIKKDCRLGGKIKPGDDITWVRRGPHKGGYYHKKCADLPFEDKEDNQEKEEKEKKNTQAKKKSAKKTQPNIAKEEIQELVQDQTDPLNEKLKNLSKQLESLQNKLGKAMQVTRTLEISNQADKQVKQFKELHHFQFPQLLKLISLGFQVYIWGGPGSGKTTAAMQVAKVRKQPFGLLSLNPMSPASKLEGYGTADGTYIPSIAYKMYSSEGKGGLLCIDEFDNANGALLTSFNSALANGVGSWPLGIITEQHKDFALVTTGNTPGFGGTPAHPDRRKLDSATRDRFVVLDWEYDKDLERALALQECEEAEPWITWCQTTRKWAEENAPRVMVTPRSCIFGARLLKNTDLPMNEIYKLTVARGITEDYRTKTLKNCPLPKLQGLGKPTETRTELVPQEKTKP